MGAQAGLAGSVGSAAIMASSKDWKHDKQPIDEREVLNKFDDLTVERWRYIDQFADRFEHIGCYAEDFKDLFGVGDGRSINMIDALGVCMAAIKALSAEVKELRSAA